MATLTFDTHVFVERLIASGIKKDQAVAIVTGLKAIDLEHVASREDVAAIKTDIARVREEIANLKADIFKWIVPLMLGQTAVIAALVKLL